MSADKRDFGPASIPKFDGQPSSELQGLDALAAMFTEQSPAVAEPSKRQEPYDVYLDPNAGSASLSVEVGGATPIAPETHLNSATHFSLAAPDAAGRSLKGAEGGIGGKRPSTHVESTKPVHAGKPSADESDPGKPGRHPAPKASAAPAPAAPAASGHTMSTEFGSLAVDSSKPNTSGSPEPVSAPAPTPEPVKSLPVANRVVADTGIGRYGGTITLTPQPQQPKNPSKGQPAQEPQTGKSEAKPSAEQPPADPWDGTYDDDEEDPQELAKWYNERRPKSEPPEPITPPQAGKDKAEPLARQSLAPYDSYDAPDDYSDLGGEPANDVQHPGSKNLLEAIAAAQAAEPRVESHAGRHKKPQGRLNRLIYGNLTPDVSPKPNSTPQPNANKKEGRSWKRKLAAIGAVAVFAAGAYLASETSGSDDGHYVPKHKATVSQPTGNPTTSHNSSSFMSGVFKTVKTVEAMQAVEAIDQALNTSTPMPVETGKSTTKHAPVVHTTLELGHYRQGDHSGAGTVSGLALQALEERGVAHPSAAQIHNVATQIWQFNGEHGDPYTSKKATELPSDMHLNVPSHLIF